MLLSTEPSLNIAKMWRPEGLHKQVKSSKKLTKAPWLCTFFALVHGATISIPNF